MTLCDDCRAAEADSLHAIFWSDRTCCIARALASIPRRQRKFAALAVRDARPEQWPEIRARLAGLLGTDVHGSAARPEPATQAAGVSA
jgi:hypothetical protein